MHKKKLQKAARDKSVDRGPQKSPPGGGVAMHRHTNVDRTGQRVASSTAARASEASMGWLIVDRLEPRTKK